jgi:hypothetical protein
VAWREIDNALSFEGDLSTYYLSLASARYFVAQLLGPGDAFCQLLLPELYEPALTSMGNGVLVPRGVRARWRGGYASGVAV